MAVKKTSRVIVLEKAGPSDWKVVEAQTDGKGITLLSARVLDETRSSGIGKLANGAHIILVTNSDKALCRWLALPNATAEQVRRMVALRLETELPYPVGKSVWICEPQHRKTEGADSVTLVMAVPSEDLAAAESQLRSAGLRCDEVILDAAAIAEIVAADPTADEAEAVAAVGEKMTILAIVHNGRLCYARRVHIGTGDGTVHELINELGQCFHHYALNNNTDKPARMLLVGQSARDEDFIATLSARLGMPVAPATISEDMQLASPDTSESELLQKFPACVGALLASHRMRNGRCAAAPALRRRKLPFFTSTRFKAAIIAAVNLLLVAGLIAVLFSVRKARIAAADSLIKEGQPLFAMSESLPGNVKVLEFENRLPRPILDTLLALADIMPKGLKIASISIDPNHKVTISGIAPSVEETEKAIAAMKKSERFMNPKSLASTLQKDGRTFGITCELKKTSARRNP